MVTLQTNNQDIYSENERLKYENNSLKSNLLISQDENKTYSTSKCLNDYELEPFNTHGELPLKIKVHGVVHTIIFSKEDVDLFVNLFEKLYHKDEAKC